MGNIKLKICGLMRPQDVIYCQDCGVDMGGFVVEYPADVPWNMERSRAALLMGLVRGPMKSCIVTGGGREKILALARELRPDYIQLHYHETLEDTAHLSERLLSEFGIRVIKTLPAGGEQRRLQFASEDVKECVLKLNKTKCGGLLLDTRGPSGQGEADAERIKGMFFTAKRWAAMPVVLAGGITAENAAQICSGLKPDMIDVMTGVELSPGIKSRRRIRELLKCVQEKG